MVTSPLVVATLFWDANDASFPFSQAYTEEWVIRLFCGFQRNLTMPFDFICFSERDRDYGDFPIIQRRMEAKQPSYPDCLEPYSLDRPMILCGLDTLVTGNIDHLAEYCIREKRSRDDWRCIALPRDPYNPRQACNGVSLAPAGQKRIWTDRNVGGNDMDEVRRWPHLFIDDLFPGHVVSFKGDRMPREVGDRRIIYFHGYPKFHELRGHPIVEEHWRR